MDKKQDGCEGQDGALKVVRDADPARSFVVAQLGQSLDGRIATVSGESRWINGPAALDHLHRLRAAVDAVLVGIGTIEADNPRLDVRRCPGRNPARVIVDPSGRIDPAALVLREDGVRRILVHAGAPLAALPVESICLRRRADGSLDPREIVNALYGMGLRRLLVEGGSRTSSGFIDAGMIDRLHVLVAPLIIGSGTPGLSLSPVACLSCAARPPTRVVPLDDGDVLFDCDMSQARGQDKHDSDRDEERRTVGL